MIKTEIKSRITKKKPTGIITKKNKKKQNKKKQGTQILDFLQFSMVFCLFFASSIFCVKPNILCAVGLIRFPFNEQETRFCPTLMILVYVAWMFMIFEGISELNGDFSIWAEKTLGFNHQRKTNM